MFVEGEMVSVGWVSGLNHRCLSPSQNAPMLEERNGPLPSPKQPEPTTTPRAPPGESML